MPEITIRVRNKNPEIVGTPREIVADNTDYTVRFEFDGDWAEGPKTVLLALYGVGLLAPVTTDGDACALPRIQIWDGVGRQLAVGVQQGAVRTTRTAEIMVYPSAESALLAAMHGDPEVSLSWLEWVNANMAAAETNVREAAEILTEAQEAADSAEASAQSAAIDAAAARISAQTAAFPVFSVDERGHVIISRPERLGTTTFRLDEAGHLIVEV